MSLATIIPSGISIPGYEPDSSEFEAGFEGFYIKKLANCFYIFINV
jgi:hypothetical protein